MIGGLGIVLGLEQRSFEFLQLGNVADAAEHHVLALIGGGSECQVRAAAIVQRVFAAGLFALVGEDFRAPARGVLEPVARHFIGHDQRAVAASQQAQAHGRDLDQLAVQRHAVGQRFVLAQRWLDHVPADVADPQQHQGQDQRRDDRRRLEGGGVVAQHLPQRCVVDQSPAVFADLLAQGQVRRRPAVAQQTEGVFALVRDLAFEHGGAGAVHHGTVALVEQRVRAAAEIRGVDRRVHAGDFQADPARLRIADIKRRVQEEALRGIHRRMQPDDGRMPVLSRRDVSVAQQRLCQPFLDAGRHAGRRARAVRVDAHGGVAPQGRVDHGGVGQADVQQVARRQHQRPVVLAGFLGQGQDFDLAGVAEVAGGIGDGGLVGVAHRRGEDRAQQRFALVEEQLRVIGRRIHLAAVAGDGAAEGPVQVQGGAHHDAKERGHGENCSSTDAARGASSGRWRGLRSLPAFPAW